MSDSQIMEALHLPDGGGLAVGEEQPVPVDPAQTLLAVEAPEHPERASELHLLGDKPGIWPLSAGASHGLLILLPAGTSRHTFLDSPGGGVVTGRGRGGA